MKKKILITGASKGIGQATALILAKDFHIVAHYNKDLNGIRETIDLIQKGKGSAECIQFNIKDRKDCHEKLTESITNSGAFYGIINNAGVCQDVVFPAMEAQEWDNVVHTNLDSFYNVIKPCIMPMIQMRQGGRIITLSSASGIAGNRGQVNYSAAKAGIIGASKALALELAKRKITVNCVAPGLIETNMTRDLETKEILKHIPARRAGTPEEVASLIAYLMSNSASYITRQVISINGGLI